MLPYWVAELIQQRTDPEQDRLSPLWSPYKSSEFTLFSSAAHKLIKLAFPCCFWQRGWVRRPMRCIVGGRRVYKPEHTDTHVPHTIQFRWGQPHNCYSYQNDTFAAFAYSWINAAEGEHESGMAALPMSPLFWVRGQWGVCACCTFQSVSIME